MRLSKFNELCEKKWKNGRGDVSALHLTEASFDELFEDILKNRAGPVSIVHPHWNIVNPITRTEVQVRVIETIRDFVLVHYGGVKKTEAADGG